MAHKRKQSLRTKLFLQPKQQSRCNQTMRNIKPLRRNQPTQQEHRQTIRQNHKTNNTTKTKHRNTHRRNQHTTRGNTMLVQISDKEQNRIPQAEQYFQELGCETQVTNLQYGDYVFDEKVAVEYKTMADFIASIQDNRVFNEAINQAENYDWHYVLIHGNEHERTKCISMTKNYIPVNLYQFHGAIASLNRYTTVIECYTPWINEAFYKMYIQAKKDLSTKPIVKKFPRKDKNVAFNFLCYSIYGINWKKAKLIVDTLNLKTLNDLMKLNIDDLTKIEGIGKKTAENIINSIQ